MGTPPPDQRHASTYDWAGHAVRGALDHLRARYDYDPATVNVLDVGAGWGKYRDLLPEYPQMDACEIWQQYVDDERLRERYNEVYIEHIMDMALAGLTRVYDIIIMGDVLEHLSTSDAQQTVKKIISHITYDVMIVVPYLYVQHAEVDGNPYEEHVQDDLTPEIMCVRYPDLRLTALETRDGAPFKGLYQKR